MIHVGQLILGMTDMLRRSTGPSIRIETRIAEGLWNTRVDPAQIELAVRNLASNARDAMDDHGQLTIRVENIVLDEAYARSHDGASAGEHVLLAVSDNGRGMPAETLAQACEPFFSTKAGDAGSGLGLSMVYGFVKQSGGHVAIQSEEARGTTVSLHLPRSTREQDVLDHKRDDPVERALLRGNETVLIAEDDAGVRDAAVEMLQDLGYRILTAGDAASALTIIERGTPAVDLLFTDVVMPGPLRSTDLARRAKQQLPDLALLFTSGFTNREIFDGGEFTPAAGLLAKPYTRDALGRAIRSALDRRARDSAADKPASAAIDLRVRPLDVMLVEDDEPQRTGTAEVIRCLGHRVTAVGSAEEAMEVLAREAFDVLMTDIALPGQSGEVFAALARSVQAEIGIIFATGGTTVSESFDGTAGPVLLRKPFNGGAIAAALRKATARIAGYAG